MLGCVGETAEGMAELAKRSVLIPKTLCRMRLIGVYSPDPRASLLREGFREMATRRFSSPLEPACSGRLFGLSLLIGVPAMVLSAGRAFRAALARGIIPAMQEPVQEFDIAVLGAGSAGPKAARTAAKMGAKVAIFEEALDRRRMPVYGLRAVQSPDPFGDALEPDGAGV